jgi:hypothetical protein
MNEHCKRSTGTERKWFRNREEAEAFANDPVNTAYHGDIAHKCARCDFYHLSKPEWLEPTLTHQDAALLESMGVAVPEKMSGDLKCAHCGVPLRNNIYFLILRDGTTVCEQPCAKAMR